MAFLGALERGYRAWNNLQAIPEQQRTERQLALAQRLGQLGRDIERETADADDQRVQNQALLTERLAPKVAAREEAVKRNEAQRASDAYQDQVDGTIAVTRATGDVRGGLMDRQTEGNIRTIGAEYDGRTNLAQTVGGVNLTAQESQQRAAAAALEGARSQELAMAGKFIGNEALVPQIINATRGMQTERFGLMRELAQMNQPSTFERAVSTVGPFAVLLASTFAK
jgi:hypothetical protein